MQESALHSTGVYIPKANGKLRPLGVPISEVDTHMWNNMLTEMLRDKILPGQHAFVPGRGTLSAWRAILERARHYDFICETDLRYFFDNVDRTYIMDVLKGTDIPMGIYYWIDNLYMNQLTGEDLWDEGPIR